MSTHNQTVTPEEIRCHTPGPWAAERSFAGIRVTAGNERSITLVPLSLSAEPIGDFNPKNFNAEQEYNGRLIAAAPDLLALAQKLAGECAECSGRGYTFSDDGITGFGPDDREPTREACADCADIREVIAKAVRS